MNEQNNEDVRDMAPQPRPFNPNEHLIQIRSGQLTRDYLPVAWRLVWFRSMFPHGTIHTEMVHLDLERETEEETFVWNPERRRSEKVIKHAKGFAIFRATVNDGQGGTATGTKSEKAASFADYIEKAETGAIGRALAALGYGTQFTGDEWDEAHRIVDTPIDRGNHSSSTENPETSTQQPAAASTNTNGSQPQKEAATSQNHSPSTAEASITERQRSSIRKLCEFLGKAEPENIALLSELAARRIIQQLTAEYKEVRQNNKAS